MGEADGTADVYPPYPADWNASGQQLEVFGNLNTKRKNVSFACCLFLS
jgi:hypothetical protein